MIYELELEGCRRRFEVEATESGWRLRDLEQDDPIWEEIPGRWVDAGELLLERGGRQRAVGVAVRGDEVAIQADGHAFTATVLDPRKMRVDFADAAAEGQIRSPMPGVVVRVPVQQGQSVRQGDVVVVVEAMKMENEFKAPVSGVVEQLFVEVGQAVDANAVLATVVAAE